MNIKKIGLTALAASLVSTSVFAGELTATGSASLTVENYSGVAQNGGIAYSMADSVTLGGSTELDNGMTVSMSFELDSDNPSSSSYDNKSMTVSSDAMGTFVFAGHGGSSAVSAMDATAAGDIFDGFDGKVGTADAVTGHGDAAMLSTQAGDNSMLYTLPAMVDGLSATASFSPKESGDASSTAWALTYTGFEGLSASYGKGDKSTGVSTTEADATTMKASYAIGSFTVAYSNNDYQTAVASKDQETTSYKVSYTVSDQISVSYGTDEIKLENDAQEAEFEKLSVAYTSGGMTLTAKQASSTDALHGTTDLEDRDYWSLGLSFAF